MRLISNVQPKCSVCVDYYRGECHCQKSVHCGMALEHIPWGVVPASSRNENEDMTKPRRNERRNGRAWRNLSLEYND